MGDGAEEALMAGSESRHPEIRQITDRLQSLKAEDLSTLRSIIGRAVMEEVTPSVSLWVGAGLDERDAYGAEITLCEGRLDEAPQSSLITSETLYDLASLTKPLATALWFGILVSRGMLDPQTPIGEIVACRDPMLNRAPLWRLVNHSAGLPAHFEYYRGLIGACQMGTSAARCRDSVRRMIASTPTQTIPGERTIYSDLSYLLLEWACERVGGEDLSSFWRSVSETLSASSPTLVSLPDPAADHVYPLHQDVIMIPHFRPLDSAWRSLGDRSPITDQDRACYAATERCPWRGRALRGEVHDDNAWMLGGVCGHAGLFGSPRAVGALAQIWMRAWRGLDQPTALTPEVARWMLDRAHLAPHGGSFVLGWDTPSPGYSSAGSRFGRGSIGHLGFTGTSLWIDLEREVAIALLTNRVHPSRDRARSIQGIRQLRPRVHNEVWRLLEGE